MIDRHHRTGVLRSRPLRALLAAEVISTTGSQMTWLALPWFVLTTTGSASRMSFVVAAEVGAYALFGVPAGSVVARLGARRTMLLMDGVRAPTMLMVPLLYWTDELSYPLLLAFSFLIGALGTPYGAAQRVVVPELLGEDEGIVTQASALFQSATRFTILAGPPIAGILIGLIGAPAVLVIDAATFAAAFVLVVLLVPPTAAAAAAEAGAGPAPSDRAGVLAGVAYVRRDPLLRLWAIGLTLGDAAWQVIFVATPVLVYTYYGGHATLAGLILGGFGGGAIAGNAVSYRFFPAGVPPRIVAGVLLVQALPLWLLALPVASAVLVAALVVSGFANGIANPTLHATLTLRPPPPVRAQVISALFTASAVGGPLALLVRSGIHHGRRPGRACRGRRHPACGDAGDRLVTADPMGRGCDGRRAHDRRSLSLSNTSSSNTMSPVRRNP
jgi:predicted MFS family arabinose efflux permease